MGIVLYRIDERLIHGQVVVGWGRELMPARYVVVDDELAKSDWEQELYRLGLNEGAEAVFARASEALECLQDWKADETRSVLLTRDVGTMLELAGSGLLEGDKVNVGGMHHAEGRSRVASYVYLGDADREMLKRLEQCGVEVSARELPGSAKVSLETLLRI